MDFAILTSDTEIAVIAEEWRQLHNAIGTSPFSGFDYFDCWWRTTGNTNGRVLHIVTARENGKLIGVLPLAVVRRKGFRVLQATGAEAFYQADILCANPEQAQALWQAARNSKAYDFIHIRDVCPGSLDEQALNSFATAHERNRAPYLKLEWKDAETYKATLPRKVRTDLNRRLRRLEEKAPVKYTVCESLPLPEGIIEGMVKQKTAWCNELGLQGMFDQPNVLAFFRLFAAEAAKRGELFLAWLQCGEDVIAHHLALRYGKKLISYVVSNDAAYFQYSPGHLANLNAISWALEHGLEEFDHMQGDFAYKYQFANDVRECVEYTASTSFYGWLGAKLFIGRRDIRSKLGPYKRSLIGWYKKSFKRK
ncbi:MAG TPA: GNAT family N-acetyltransferase [Rickettsiales bacterium]|nr:GNAT family N-acetyltransferase [Rickettsiales bacterium]